MKAVCLLVWAMMFPAGAFAAVTCTPTNNSVLFGTYNPLNATNVDSTATFVITCSNTSNQVTVNYTATLSGQTLRQLAPPLGTDRLNYNLYTDSTRATIWGDGTAGTGTITGSITIPKRSTATTTAITYYGRITPGQDVSATASGSTPTTYSQALTITVTCAPTAC